MYIDIESQSENINQLKICVQTIPQDMHTYIVQYLPILQNLDQLCGPILMNDHI